MSSEEIQRIKLLLNFAVVKVEEAIDLLNKVDERNTTEVLGKDMTNDISLFFSTSFAKFYLKSVKETIIDATKKQTIKENEIKKQG